MLPSPTQIEQCVLALQFLQLIVFPPFCYIAPTLRRAFQITSLNGTFWRLHPTVRRHIILTFRVPANVGSVHALKVETAKLVQATGLIVDFEVGDVPSIQITKPIMWHRSFVPPCILFHFIIGKTAPRYSIPNTKRPRWRNGRNTVTGKLTDNQTVQSQPPFTRNNS